jgi:hypothetical protein
MAKKYLSLERLTEYDTLIKAEIKSGDEATLSEIDSKIDEINTSISNIANGKADAKHEHTVSEISDLTTYEFITTADIDAICSSSIVAAREEGVIF